MNLRTRFGMLRLLFILALLFCGMSLSLAQTKSTAQGSAPKTIQATPQPNNSRPATEPSQMRGTTTEHRWAAAPSG